MCIRDSVRRDPSAQRGVRKGAPADQTNAESFYYLKQMQARTPIVVRLVDGEELRGWIEWYDKDALKLNRATAPNLLLQKSAIKYLYKEEEERQFRRRPVRAERGRPEEDGGASGPPGAPPRCAAGPVPTPEARPDIRRRRHSISRAHDRQGN